MKKILLSISAVSSLIMADTYGAGGTVAEIPQDLKMGGEISYLPL